MHLNIGHNLPLHQSQYHSQPQQSAGHHMSHASSQPQVYHHQNSFGGGTSGSSALIASSQAGPGGKILQLKNVVSTQQQQKQGGASGTQSHAHEYISSGAVQAPKMQFSNQRVSAASGHDSQSNVSPVITTTKMTSGATLRSNYLSVKVQGNSSSQGTSEINFSKEGGIQSHSQSNAGSGSNTPNNLSQQNLIKIMKKIKTTQGVNTQTAGNKENLAVAPPNIISNIRTSSNDHQAYNGGTTPTEAPQIILQAQNQSLLSNYHSNQSIQSSSSQQHIGQKRIISINKLTSNNIVRSSKESVSSAQQVSSNAPPSQSSSATNQNQKIINLQHVAQQLQNAQAIAAQQQQKQAQSNNPLQATQKLQLNNNTAMNNQKQEVSPVHIHYHNIINQVQLNVSPSNATTTGQQMKVTTSSNGGIAANNGKQIVSLLGSQASGNTSSVTVSSVFMNDNARKKSISEKFLNPPMAANFNRKGSLPQKNSNPNSVLNVSPISSHRGSASSQPLKQGVLKQSILPKQSQQQQQEGNKVDIQFAQQIQQKLQMQQQAQIAQQQQSISLEDSLDNTQRQQQQQEQQKQSQREGIPINFYPQNDEGSSGFSFSQTPQSYNEASAKQVILSQITKYIKLKQNDEDIKTSDDIIENLREFLAYLEEKQIINITQLQHDQTTLQQLIQNLMRLDLTKLKQDLKKDQQQKADEASAPVVGQRSSSGQSHQFNQQRVSVSSNKTSRRQGTPVSQVPTANSNQSDSTLSLSISNLSNFQKRRSSIIGSGDNSPHSNKPRTNSQQSYQSQKGTYNAPTNQSGPYINVQVHGGKVNNINISPIVMVGNNNQGYGSKPQSKPIILSENVPSSNHPQGQDKPAQAAQLFMQQNPQMVGGRRGSDSQIVQRNLAKLSNQTAVTKKIQNVNGSGNDMIVPQSGIQHRVGSAEQKRTENSTKMKLELQQKQIPTSQGTKIINDPDDLSSKDSQAINFKLNQQFMEERDKLIKYNRAYIKKNQKIPTTTLDFYKFVKLIGKGAFGKVTLGVHKLTGKYVAIKAIDKNYMKDEFSKKKVFQEVFILKKIRHSNIIRLLEVFESQKHFLMVMEYAGGSDLLQYVKQRRRLEEQEAKYMFKQIVFGLGHCHCRSVLHRDIKLDNILMDVEGSIKICDFGVSRLINKGQEIREQCGTPAYLAPEIIADEGYEGFYVDIWSLGILLYAMLQGTVPFKASNLQDLHSLILQGNFQYPVPISQDAKDLIQRMLELVPHQRISIPEILNHPWMKGALDPEGIEGTEEDDDHDFRTSISFQRQECNLNPLLGQRNTTTGTAAMANASTAVTVDQSPLYPGGNINQINIDNLFYDGLVTTKLSYMNYCSLTQDYYTHRIDEEAIRILENFGYPRSVVIESLKKGDLNHATATYNLLVLP